MKIDSKNREEKVFLRLVVVLGVAALVAYVCTSCYTTKKDKPKFGIEKPVSAAFKKAQELFFVYKK